VKSEDSDTLVVNWTSMQTTHVAAQYGQTAFLITLSQNGMLTPMFLTLMEEALYTGI